VKRWAVLCVATVALVSLPAVADAEGVLVSVTPHKQVSDGHGSIDISVSVAAGATSTCTLFDDSGELEVWRPCHTSYSFNASNYPDGDYRLAARARLDGVQDWAASYFSIDSTDPETEISSQYPQLLTSGYFYASWSLKRRDSSPTFEVQEQLDSPFSGLGEWKTRDKTDRNSMKFTIDPGETVCVRVRAEDLAGNVGPWSRELCRTRYVDDRDLDGWRGSNKWDAIPFSSDIEGTALVSKSKGATVTLPSLRVSQLVLFGRKGPYGGSIEIRIGGDVVDRISLKSSEPKAATLFRGDWRDARSGRFVIEVTSDDGRYVHLDALIIRRAS
jgi:hypothetical protein